MARSDEVGLGLALKSTNRRPIGLARYGMSVFAPYSRLDPLEDAREALGFVTQLFSDVLKLWIGFWSESEIFRLGISFEDEPSEGLGYHRTTLPVG